MGVAYNPSIITDGLVLLLDAGNPKSYSGSGSNWFDQSGNKFLLKTLLHLLMMRD